MSSVDSRTQLAGRNRLELLVFGLGNDQRFGINVFKVREVIRCPKLTEVPHSDDAIRGIADVRGHTITVIDLSQAIGKGRMTEDEVKDSFVIITEYNRAVQGFLVHSVDRIVNMSWKEVLSPPSGTNNSNFLTAVARIDKQLVEIIDVEQIFARVVGVASEISDDVMHQVSHVGNDETLIIVADDSVVARKQIETTLEQMHLASAVFKNGKEAIDQLRNWADHDPEKLKRIGMVVSDIEMPTMDGYTLTSLIRQDSRLKHLYIVLHSSLSGVFNESMVKQVGADRFIPKFHPDDLARVVAESLEKGVRHVENEDAE